MPIKLSFKKFPKSDVRFVYLKIHEEDPDAQLIDEKYVSLFGNCNFLGSSHWTSRGEFYVSKFDHPRFLKAPDKRKRMFSIKSGSAWAVTLSAYIPITSFADYTPTPECEPEDSITTIT